MSRLVILLPILWYLPQLPAAAKVDYAKQIRPLLSRRCYECHGPEKQESGLRVDTIAAMKEGGVRGEGLLPGEGEKSLLIEAVLGTDDDLVMPPEGDRLSEAEIKLITKWIDEGAVGVDEPAKAVSDPRRQHWSFQPVRRPALPQVVDQTWCQTPLDRFILARLEAAAIAPSGAADRATLARRLSLDLIGLPPSVEEVDRFVADSRPDAYERLVDRLLASPRYGERWGRHWLDLARYGDSNGFTIDSARSIWKYRDWVIDAINRDLPFDEFTIEQLAGDMLADATRAQRIATGFHRNTLINQEGGTDREQFRVEAVVDRVNTTGAVYLGLTIGCAQCHDHKYDPISQREYYQLFAILNNSAEPTLEVSTAEQTARLAELSRQVAAADKELKEFDRQAQPKWEQEVATAGAVNWQVLKPIEFDSSAGAEITPLKDHSLLVGDGASGADVYTVVAPLPIASVRAVRLEALTDESLPGKGPGRAQNGNFVLGELKLSLDDGKIIELAKASADFSQSKYPIANLIDGNSKTGWAIGGATGGSNVDRTAIIATAEPIAAPAGARLRVVLEHQAYSNTSFKVGRLRLAVTASAAALLNLSDEVHQALLLPAAKRSKEQQAAVAAAYQQHATGRSRLAKAAAAAKKRRDDYKKTVPTTLVMEEMPTPRETHVHIRGDFLNKGQRVEPGVPDVLPPLADEVKQPNRLDLARWLVDPQHPLTSRVTVNRHWQRLFGHGLVETENDFGTQGTLPTHPELLDYLAGELVRLDWDGKRLHRLIVTSAVYRQSSAARSDLAEVDPRNELLARQNRLRLEAEGVRDAALAASGLLANTIGGPSVYPPQPKGLDLFTQARKNWKDSTGSARYRRGMYTFFWRSNPHPFLATFDAPDANSTCTRRARSNTPLQALTLANDVTFIEMARALAGRVLNSQADDDAQRVERAFRLAMARQPSAHELEILTRFVESQRRQFAAETDDARQFAPRAVAGKGRPTDRRRIYRAGPRLNEPRRIHHPRVNLEGREHDQAKTQPTCRAARVSHPIRPQHRRYGARVAVGR